MNRYFHSCGQRKVDKAQTVYDLFGMTVNSAYAVVVPLNQFACASTTMGQFMILVDVGAGAVTDYGVPRICEAAGADDMTTFIMGFGAGMLTGMAVDSLNPSVPRRPGSMEMDSGEFHTTIRELQRKGYLGDGSGLPSSFADMMSPEDAAQYTHFLEYGGNSGLTPSELAGIQRLDDCLALGRVDYDEVLALRRLSGVEVGDGVENRTYSGDLMSPEDAAQYSEHWRKLGIGSDKTWNEFRAANPNGTIDDYFEIVQKQSPWPLGYTPVEITLNSGDTFEMALGVGQPPSMPGRFATSKGNIVNVKYVRNDLAVKIDWKSEIDRVVVYQVKDNVSLTGLQGIVGPQIDLNANTYLRGGADQINILLDRNANGMDYFDIISITPIY